MPCVELWAEAQYAVRKRKATNKTRYTCSSCKANAWSQPEPQLAYDAYSLPMEVQRWETATGLNLFHTAATMRRSSV